MHLTCIASLYPVRMELSTWVKLARQKKGLTQEGLADALGVTKGNISAWENSRHEPGWEQILKIGRLTRMALPIPRELQISIPDEAAELIESFCTLAPDDQALIMHQVKRLADLTSNKVNEPIPAKDGTMGSDASRQAPTKTEAPKSVDKRRHRIASPEEAAQSGRKMGVERAKRGEAQEGGKS